MKRMFKSTISLLLIAAFLLTPLVGTTASASDEFDMLKYYEYWCDECLTKIKNNANKY
ncbi:MAG: hypothetical protein IJW76_04015 [Clostridia bacterium]|nr:hypothetical protein [Clostridia bacterium]